MFAEATARMNPELADYANHIYRSLCQIAQHEVGGDMIGLVGLMGPAIAVVRI